MKNSDKITKIKPLIENIRLLSIGMEDIAQSGDDGWFYALRSNGQELREYITQISEILDPPIKEEIIKRDPEPGTQAHAIREFGDKVFAYFCRIFREIPIEELVPMKEIDCIAWAEDRLVELSPVYKDLYFNHYPVKGFQMVQEAYQKVVLVRKRKNTQTDLFENNGNN